MGRDDLILATDIVITALSRLWVYETKRTDSEESNYERMKRVTEDIADRALLKVLWISNYCVVGLLGLCVSRCCCAIMNRLIVRHLFSIV